MRNSPDWVALFPADRSLDAYRRAMLSRTPLTWEIVEESQSDLLRLLVGRVSAEIGSQVILALAVLFRTHPKAEQASQSLLSTIMFEVDPPRARTLVMALSDAWTSAQRHPPHRGPEIVRDAVVRAARRLVVLDIPPSERNALGFILDMLAGEDS